MTRRYLLSMCLLAAVLTGCGRITVQRSGGGGAGTFDYTQHGFKFTYLHDDSVNPRQLRGVLYPADYPHAGHVTTSSGYTFIAANHKEVEFPPGKDFAVVSRNGKLRFLGESLANFCPDFEEGGAVRYGLKLDLLMKSPLWVNEIQPWLQSE